MNDHGRNCSGCGTWRPRDSFRTVLFSGRVRWRCGVCADLPKKPPACVVCEGMSWRVRGPRCRRCGLEYAEEQVSVLVIGKGWWWL